MRIAYLAWGSLVTQTKCLEIKRPWTQTGPTLPVEFARISDNLRLTLVLFEGAAPVRTFAVRANHDELGDAIDNLRLREGSPRCERHAPAETVASLELGGTLRGHLGPVKKQALVSWLSEQRYDAAVWTALQHRLEHRGHSIGSLTAENAASYLRSLAPRQQAQAKAYFDSVPVEIQTGLRARIESLMEWRAPNAT